MCKYLTYLTCFFLLLGLFGSTVSAAEEIWGEAESADSLTAPLQIGDDPNASGGQYIANPTVAGPSNTNPPTTGIATYSVTIAEGGVYRMYLRVRCTVAGDDDDSCYVRIQGATLNLTGLTENWISDNNIDYEVANSTDWFWKQVGHYAAWPGNDPVEMTMAPGTYTLEIAYREDGLLIDGFLITNEADFDPNTLPDEIPAAAPEPTVPFSVGAVTDVTLGNDSQVGPDQNNNGSGMHARNIGGDEPRRLVALISYDISSLNGRGPVSNVTLNNFGHDGAGQVVNVYGIVEDLDSIDGSVTWSTAPGVQNDPIPPLNTPISVDVLDLADLTDILTTFVAPEQGVRGSSEPSAAMDDFINSDTDGIVTFILVPSAEGVDVTIRTTEHSAGGTLLEGDIPPIANIIWVSDNAKYDFDADQPADAGFVDLLRAQGYKVDYKGEAWPYDPNDDNIALNPDWKYWQSLDPSKIDELNAADLVIISRIANSGAYDDKPDEIGGIDECVGWNSVTTPMISMSAHLARSGYSKWGWLNCSGHPYVTENVHNILEPGHAIFAGVEVDLNGQADLLTDEYTVNGSDATDAGNGVTLATRVADNAIMIAVWDTGVEYFDGSGYFAGGPRMFFAAGSGNGSPRDGIYNLTEDGMTVFLNAVEYMLPVKPVDPGMDNLVAYYPLDGDVLDASGNGLDGTIVGDPNFVEGKEGMALSLNGSTYVDCGDDPLHFDITDAITLAAWVIPDIEAGKDKPIVQNGDEVGIKVKNNDTLEVYFHAATTDSWYWANIPGTQVSEIWADSSWHYVTGTYDSATGLLNLYVDGELVSNNTNGEIPIDTKINLTAEPVNIGRDSKNTSRIFTGLIDEVRIYNRALSATEIRYIAQ